LTDQPTLQTERLILRPFVPADAPEVQRLAGDPLIASTTLSIPHPYPDGAAEQWIAGHAGKFAGGEEVQFAVTRRAGGTLLGAIGLTGISNWHQHAEMGYWIGRAFWGQGYATEAARALLAYAFGQRKLNRVHACHFTRNPASGRVMQKIGMQYEGRQREHVKKEGLFEDCELYGILRRDFYDR
jgi:RimJ/RimL family protein N-acetyltransferase